jgi:hypothetical protein
VRRSQYLRDDQEIAMELTRAFTILLLVVHLILGAWALIGFAEWFSTTVPWPPVSNPLLPRDILFMQWTLVLVAALVFLGGYALGWAHTPAAMACVYGAMGALCAVETFRYLESDLRFVAMALEYSAYAGILLFLFRSSLFTPRVT